VEADRSMRQIQRLNRMLDIPVRHNHWRHSFKGLTIEYADQHFLSLNFSTAAVIISKFHGLVKVGEASQCPQNAERDNPTMAANLRRLRKLSTLVIERLGNRRRRAIRIFK